MPNVKIYWPQVVDQNRRKERCITFIIINQGLELCTVTSPLGNQFWSTAMWVRLSLSLSLSLTLTLLFYTLKFSTVIFLCLHLQLSFGNWEFVGQSRESSNFKSLLRVMFIHTLIKTAAVFKTCLFLNPRTCDLWFWIQLGTCASVCSFCVILFSYWGIRSRDWLISRQRSPNRYIERNFKNT
jgi:hypothetical protein